MNVIRIAAGLIGKNDPDENGQRGLIVNTSGSEAFRGTTGQTLMSATSGAIHSMTKVRHFVNNAKYVIQTLNSMHSFNSHLRPICVTKEFVL